MSRRTLLSLALLLSMLAALSGLTQAVWAQEVTASVVGTITDPSGAPITGATVIATDVDRGTNWTVKTNDTGVYDVARLPIGNYIVKVSAAGFQTASYPQFTLVLNQTARVDVQMKIGQTSETVEVVSAAPLLQTESTEVSTLIDANTNVSLPLASRNYLQLTLLAPGATNVNPDSMRQPQTMTNSGRPYINGNREQANSYLIDGIVNSEDKNNETGYTPNIDAIQEFNLITQNASAEFGNYQGGIVSATIKSGTNKFHGDVFEFFRNDALDAHQASDAWSQGINNGLPGFDSQGVAKKAELRYNMFGGTLGGPIVPNKLFFFADYQGQRMVTAGATGAQLLTNLARQGNFGQLCNSGFTAPGGVCADPAFGPNALDLDQQGNPKNTAPVAGNQLVVPNSGGANNLYYFNPAQIPAGGSQPTPIQNNVMSNAGLSPSSVATALFGMTKYYPLPQLNNLSGNNYFYKSGKNLNNNQGDLRVDYFLASRDRVFGRWSQMDLTQPTFTGCVFCNNGAAEGNDEPVRNGVVDWTHTFTPRLLNEARFGFNAVRYDERFTPTSSLGNISQQLGITGGNLQAPGLVEIQVPTNAPSTYPSLGLRNLIQVFHTTQGQVEDNLIIDHGRHQFKTGFQLVRERQDYAYQGNNGALGFLNINSLTGAGIADLYLGILASGSFRDTGGVVSSPAKLRGNILAGYVQDNWRVTNDFTLNLGLRFEDHSPLYEANDRVVNFGLFTGTIYTADGRNGTAKFGNRALYNNYLGIGDWLPRIGFSWTPAWLGGKTVVRGGFGISTFMEGGGSNEELTLNVPFGILQQPSAATGVGTLAQGFGATLPNPCPTISQTCYAGNRVRIFDQNFKPAMIDQWNFTIQHQLTNTLTFQIGYVGQRGSHLLNFEDVAQRVGLNAQGQIAQPGELIVSQRAGPFLGGGNVPCAATPNTRCGAAGSLYQFDQAPTNASGQFGCCGALAGTNMSNSDQKYNALQAVLQKRMGSGLQAQVAYTWSKCMSNSPGYFGTGWGSTSATSSGGQPGWENIYNPRKEWGACYYDQAQIASSYLTYQLPVGHGKQFGRDMNPVLNAVVGNWEVGALVALHSGNALTLNEFGGWGVGGDTSHTGGIEPFTLSGRPDCSGPIHIVNKRVAPSGGSPGFIQWFDTSNVTDPAPYTFGTCGIGNVRGPSYADADLSLHKDFLITESKRLEFRWEALNAFNHPTWTFNGGPANGSFNTGNANFGHITGSQGARQLQFGLKFYY